MMRRFLLTTAVVMCMALQATPSVRAAEALLGVIPEDALGFVVINRLAEVDAKVQALGTTMQLPVPSFLGLLKLEAHIETGLDEKGSAAVVVMPGDDADSVPDVLAMLPVTDYAALMKQLGAEETAAEIIEITVAETSLLVGNRAGYAVVAWPSDRDRLEEVLGAPQRVAADVAPMQQWLAEGDIDFVVTRRGVEVLSVLGQQGLQQVREELAALPEGQQEGMEAAIGVFTVYQRMIEAIGEEVNNAATVVRIDDDGNLHVQKRLRLNPGSRFGKMLAEVETPSYNLLTGLPPGPFVIAGGGTLTEAMGEELMGFSAAVMKAAPGLYGFNEEQVDQMIEASRQSMKGFRGMSMSMGVGKPGDPIYGNLAVVEKVDDTETFMANYAESIETMKELTEEGTGSIFGDFTIEETEVGGVEAWELTVEIPAPPTAAAVPDYDEIMEKIFGPAGTMVIYIAAADEQTIVASYMGQELLRRCLDVVEGDTPGLAADPSLAKTIALLPSDGQWVGYLSPKGVVDFVKRVIPVFAPEEADMPELPEFAETPPIGFSSKATPDGVTAHGVVPAEVFEAIGDFAAELRQED